MVFQRSPALKKSVNFRSFELILYLISWANSKLTNWKYNNLKPINIYYFWFYTIQRVFSLSCTDFINRTNDYPHLAQPTWRFNLTVFWGTLIYRNGHYNWDFIRFSCIAFQCGTHQNLKIRFSCIPITKILQTYRCNRKVWTYTACF